MNDSNETEYILDEQLLSNMKNSDDELMDDQRMEEQDVDLKAPIDDNSEVFADPLQDINVVCSNFPWLFKDEDVIYDEKLSEVSLQPVKSRGKRGRPASGTFICSNGQTWILERETPQRGTDESPPAKQQACGKGPVKCVANAVEAWMLLFDDDMLRMLQRIVNEQIRKRRTRNDAERLTDLTELRSWLGLKYLCGVFRNSQHNGPLEELWTLELGNAIFRATMSLTRFIFITEMLSNSVDGFVNDGQRLWQKFLINCRSYYGSSTWLCVDEVAALDGKQVLICCDAKTQYMTNALLARHPTTPSKELMQLICDYKTTPRNITLGSRFASAKHCEQLLQCSLTSICRLQPTASDYPKNWTDGALISGSKRLAQRANVALLSCGLNRQLDAFQIHQHTAQTCAQFHELSQRYSTTFSLSNSQAEEQSNEFLQLLHLLLNMAAVNAWVLLRLSSKGNANIDQRDFQRQLGLFLTQQRLQRRLQRRSTATTLVMRLQICEILGQSNQRLLSEAAGDAQQRHGVGVISLGRAMLPEDVTLVSRYGEKHRRCKPCARNKRETKARSRCQQCQAHRCGNHLISRCYECMGVTESQLPEGNIKDNN
ncbi:hypothetical protein KR093_011043 [Drosophila rubida]|uniref:PiggyBac transposable element-derived protein domain-containing protein n=1 Tax=Drosophila rubida TaxID=30044 RepID=A0AAD4K4Q3_9MUSC|nr:hypothetical protein KR093_011043 [Drosophila rubida]